MRRLLVAVALALAVALGLVAAYAVHRMRQGADVRGSVSTEYVTTQPPEARPPSKAPWPTYGYTGDRTRAADLPLRPPFRTVWRYQAGSLVEFPPSIGYGRLFFSTNKGTFTAVGEKTGQYAWKYHAGRCVAASPAIGPHAHGTVYEAFLNRPPCNAQNGGHGVDGEVIAFSVGHGKIHWRHTIGPSESSPLLVGDRLYVGDWNGDVWAFDANHGRVLWKRHVAHAAIKGAPRKKASATTPPSTNCIRNPARLTASACRLSSAVNLEIAGMVDWTTPLLTIEIRLLTTPKAPNPAASTR